MTKRYNNSMNILKRIVNFAIKALSNTENPAAWFPFGEIIGGKRRSNQEMYYGIVFACIDVIAQGVSSQRPKLYIDDGDDSPDEILEDDILKPFKQANKLQSGSDILYLTSAYIDTYGIAYIWPVKNLKGFPIELWSLDPAKMNTVKARSNTTNVTTIVGYIYNEGDVKIPFDVDEIVRIPRPNPWNQLEGISTIQMARHEAESDLDAIDYNKQFFNQGARPDGVLTTEAEEPISDDVFARLKKQWNEAYGGTKNAHKTVILEQGLKYQQISLNQKDMDFINQRKLSRDGVMSVFRVPKPILAISDDVNRANAESGEYVFAKWTLKPRLDLIYGKLNAFYVPMFPNSEKKYLEYENPVPEDSEKAASIRDKEINKIKTVNEARAEIGLPAYTGGDKLYIEGSMIPVGEEKNDAGNNENEPKNGDKNGEKTTPPPVGDSKHQAKNQKNGKHRQSRGVVVSIEDNMRKLFEFKSQQSKFFANKKRFINKQTKRLESASMQLYSDMIREIKRTPIKKDEEDTPEIWLSKIMPSLDAFKALAFEVFLRYSEENYTQGLKDVEKYYELTINFDLVATGASNWLKERANMTASSMRDSMINKARSLIADQLNQPDFTLEKAKNEVLKVFSDEAEYRSLRIARTETGQSYTEANVRAYKGSGVVEKLKWIVNDPCEQCQPNEGQVRSIGEVFPTGHEYPLVHPNCECDVAPYFGI